MANNSYGCYLKPPKIIRLEIAIEQSLCFTMHNFSFHTIKRTGFNMNYASIQMKSKMIDTSPSNRSHNVNGHSDLPRNLNGKTNFEWGFNLSGAMQLFILFAFFFLGQQKALQKQKL